MDRIENIHRDGMDEVLFKTELAQGLLDANEELERIDIDDLRKAKRSFHSLPEEGIFGLPRLCHM
jgi:hypothetical protein